MGERLSPSFLKATQCGELAKEIDDYGGAESAGIRCIYLSNEVLLPSIANHP